MTRKTIDNWNFEQFTCNNLSQVKNVSKDYRKLYFKRTDDGKYVIPLVQFGFECWVESKRLERDHAKG